MFKITPIQDIESQKECAIKCGTEYQEGYFAYEMRDIESGELMGFSQFELIDGCGYISDIVHVPGLDDFEAMFILGRQTMNFLNICGASICKTRKGAADDRLIKAIGFRDGVCNLEGMFDGNCGGHNN